MALSVNTNVGALVALQNLNATNRQLDSTQNRIATGLKVAGAKDNGAVFAIAQNMRADIAGLGAVKQSLDRGVSVVDVALAAGTAVSDLLNEMKAKAVAATDTGLDATSRAALSADFAALESQLTTIVDNAVFNGKNLLQRTSSNLTVLSNDSGGTITVNAQDFSISDGLGISAALNLSTATAASALATNVDAAIASANSKLAALGTGSKSLSTHAVFVGKLQDALTTGIGNLVDADLAKESANLQSQQIKQQLGAQALSIANQQPQIILSLFQ